jgi:hypothetical protein
VLPSSLVQAEYDHMMDCIELNSINQYILAKQHLAENPSSVSVTAVVRDVVGLHATNARTPYLSLLARVPNFKKEQLQAALYDEHSLARIRCVRKTIYVQCADGLPTIYAATGKVAAKASENFMVYRGVSMADYEILSDQIIELLAGKSLTAAEIKQALSSEQDISAVLYYMCDSGLLLRGSPVGGWLDKQHHYCLFADVYPGMDLEAMSEKDAVAKLVRDYIAGFGPVSGDDIVWWTGLGKIRMRSALRSLRNELVDVHICGLPDTYHMLKDNLDALRELQAESTPSVSLLPALDGYLMGYADRSRFLDPKYRDRVLDRSGNVTNAILVDGQIMGVWDVGDEAVPTVKIHMFEFVQQLAGERIYAQAKQIGEFIYNSEVRFRQCDKMEPLESRTAGAFMSPLADC